MQIIAARGPRAYDPLAPSQAPAAAPGANAANANQTPGLRVPSRKDGAPGIPAEGQP